MAATSTAARLSGSSWGILRADERRLVATAGLVFALASGGAAMAAAAADAMFLSELGPAHLGGAVAASSALLAVVLAVVGGLADRLERRRVLASLAVVSAIALAALAALSLVWPRAAAVSVLIGGKQLAAATDLAFWVAIAERVDARRSRRLLPVLAATGGVGAAIGAVLVVPLAAGIGARGILVCAAGWLALAGVGAAGLPATRRVARPPAGLARLVARSWRDGARAVQASSLARHLALVVAVAGAFASLAYFALGVSVAAQGGSTADLAELLGGVRGAGQILTLIVQLAIAPRLLARLGPGQALLAAPMFALAAGVGLIIAPVLAVAIATQSSARALDAGVETPAEKLVQTLLPAAVRGRIAGFLDGTAKRAGAVLGGLVAAALGGAPAVFYAATALAAAVWLFAAVRIARELPALAIEHAAGGADRDAVVDERAIAALIRELGGPRPERAAEVLARLTGRGAIDAVRPLADAAIARGGAPLWRALIAALARAGATGGVDRAPGVGSAIAAALLAAGPRDRPLAVRALGLAGGVPGDAVDAWRSAADPALALTAEIARLRLTGDDVLAAVGDAIRDGGAAVRGATGVATSIGASVGASVGASIAASIAIDELAIEIARSRGAGDARAPAAARHLVRALRRGHGDPASRTRGFAALAELVARVRDQRAAELSLLRADLLELARERVEAGASPQAPADALTSLARPPGDRDDAAPEIAAALRLLGGLLDGADAIEAEDLRRIARALGEPDDEVRAAAEDALTALGSAATGELIATAAWDRRRARDRAAALLADLPVTPAALGQLIDAELDALERTHAVIAVLTEPGDELLARRLDERLHEIAHTVLLLVAAGRRSPAIARAAVAWRHARGGLERARTLAVIEAALPRPLVGRLVDAVDDLTPADRAAALARAGIAPPPRDAALRTELAGGDRLARALVLHTIGAAGRSAHRAAITEAARAEAIALSPRALVRKLSHALDRSAPPQPDGVDMPSRVETLIALGRIPLLASLTTRQLADVAERARWSHASAGAIVVTAGDLLDALIVVDDGELAHGDRRIARGDVVDELACVAPIALAADLRVTRSTRLIRLERIDFEELVDDVPGLAAAVCRALGERARRADDHAYRSPLASRL